MEIPISEIKTSALEMLKHYPNGLSIHQLAVKTAFTDSQMTMAISALIIDGKIQSVPTEFYDPMKYTICS